MVGNYYLLEKLAKSISNERLQDARQERVWKKALANVARSRRQKS